MTPWWAAYAPVTLSVVCGDQNHELHWAAGTLSAPGHPDGDRERALTALGADPPRCLQILEAWNRRADDLDVLVLASRGPTDPLPDNQLNDASYASTPAYFYMQGPPTATGGTAYRPTGGRGHVDLQHETLNDVRHLLSLGSGLPRRLIATVIGTWAERIETGDERVPAALPALDAAVYGRLRAALLLWLGSAANVAFTLRPADAKPAVRRDGDELQVELPFAWLRDVWANGLAVIFDRFCIEAQQTTPGSWTLTTVDRDLASTHTLTISA